MYKTFSSERKNPISVEIICLAFATEFLSFDRGEDWNVLTPGGGGYSLNWAI